MRWRGLKALVHDAIDGTVELVRAGQASTTRSVLRATNALVPNAGGPVEVVSAAQALGTGAVLNTVKFANRTIQKVTDVGLDMASVTDSEDVPRTEGTPSVSAVHLSSTAIGTRGWWTDAAIGALNGAVGDYLEAHDNSLRMPLSARIGDDYFAADSPALPEALGENTRSKLAIFVHGLGVTEWSWFLDSERYHGDANASFATLLNRDLDYSPVYIRYNTGAHISDNGDRLSALIDAVVRASPHVVEDILLIGHSMGGLVVHSAARQATAEHRWPSLVSRVFYLGSPHAGAPLAKLGHSVTHLLARVDLPSTQVIARILDRRSSGVKDLRHGAIVDEDWLKPHPLLHESLPLSDADHHFISATITRDAQHPIGRLVGDLLVRSASASGSCITSEFPIDTRHYGGVLHHQLQNHPAVYE